jgi:hypothetical protein
MSITIPGTPFVLPTTTLLPSAPVLTQGSSTYTFQLSDASASIMFTNPSGCNATIPAATFPVTTQIHAIQYAAGQVAILAGAGVTIHPTPPVTSSAQYRELNLLQVQADTWVVFT